MSLSRGLHQLLLWLPVGIRAAALSLSSSVCSWLPQKEPLLSRAAGSTSGFGVTPGNVTGCRSRLHPPFRVSMCVTAGLDSLALHHRVTGRRLDHRTAATVIGATLHVAVSVSQAPRRALSSNAPGNPVRASQVAQEMQETQVQSLGWEDLLEKEMATHSSILAWRIPRTEETGRPQSMRV